MRVQEGLELIRSPHGRRWLWRTARQRLYSRRVAIGVRRQLSVPYDVPPAKIPLAVRPLRPDDDLSFIAEAPGLSLREAQRRADQRWFLSAGLPNCWVAVAPDGQRFLFNARLDEAIPRTIDLILNWPALLRQ